jgi:hypothetical protein
VLKDLHQKNLFVPVVGNFGGPKALRSVGKYVRDHGATVAAMYLSNVEQYLQQDGIWGLFCANVASMPLDDKSTFIRSFQGGNGGGGSGLTNGLGSMLNETRACAGRSSARSSDRAVCRLRKCYGGLARRLARRRPIFTAIACAVAYLLVQVPSTHAREGIPARLTDAEFRALITDLSEPEGRFSSDNLVSNEDTFQWWCLSFSAP